MSERPPVRTKENFLVFGSPALEQAETEETDAYPEAARIGRQIVSLPISARLKEQDVTDVITAVRRVLEVE